APHDAARVPFGGGDALFQSTAVRARRTRRLRAWTHPVESSRARRRRPSREGDSDGPGDGGQIRLRRGMGDSRLVLGQTEATGSSVTTEDDVAAFAETLGKRDLHFLRFGVRHRVQVRVQAWHEPLTEPAYDGRCLDAFLVIVEPLLGCETGHADVVAGFAVA